MVFAVERDFGAFVCERVREGDFEEVLRKNTNGIKVLDEVGFYGSCFRDSN